jgi:2-succinyl-6-hydroxy-2,4-cyclohexadiene-1-carboxylate synthase
MLHGFGGLATDWKNLITQLGTEYYCIAPDLPGHGESPLPATSTEISLSWFAKEVTGLIESLELEDPILLGYSMGGRVALQCALDHPTSLQALVLESTSPGLEGDHERQLRSSLDSNRADRLRKFGAEDFFEEWYHQPLFDSISEQSHLVTALIEARALQDSNSLAMVLEQLSPGRQAPLWNELKRLHIPVKLLSGANDREYSRISRRMTEMVPHSEWTVIADAGHNCHLEQPLAFSLAVKRFIEEKLLVRG